MTPFGMGGFIRREERERAAIHRQIAKDKEAKARLAAELSAKERRKDEKRDAEHDAADAEGVKRRRKD